MITSFTDGPSTAVTAIANSTAGNAISASLTRISTLSSARKYPAAAPISVPNTALIATTDAPMIIDNRAPHTTRDHSDRPKLSVPNRCSADGGRNFWRIASLSGSTHAIHGASAATMAMTANSASPVRNSR